MSIANKRVFYIKLVHSVVFLFMVFSLFYILYCAVTRTYNWWLLGAIAAIFLEGLVLIISGWRCPFTTLAEKYGAENGAVTDIFCPGWLAPHTFKIFTPFFIIELIWLAIDYFLLK
ncbi:MAG TPA: hypothetical protein VJ377_01655 [Dehalococcoidales bacterium]|nr:MAG: hypothetical protein A2Z05_06895 [Chloroflexi bacterium RBG_16_60_22]HJX12212.1 hypothetical protein [Dehalococcoidales bacterium]